MYYLPVQLSFDEFIRVTVYSSEFLAGFNLDRLQSYRTNRTDRTILYFYNYLTSLAGEMIANKSEPMVTRTIKDVMAARWTSLTGPVHISVKENNIATYAWLLSEVLWRTINPTNLNNFHTSQLKADAFALSQLPPLVTGGKKKNKTKRNIKKKSNKKGSRKGRK